MDVLKTLNKLPKLNTAVILIVGSQGVGKHRLSQSIVDNAHHACIQCRTATSLPLPAENSASRPRIDYVAFMIDLTNRHSFSEVQKSLQFLDKNFFIGRVCLIATQVTAHRQQCVEVERLTQLTDAYDIPLLWADLEDDGDRTELAKKLVTLVSVSAGLVPGVSPLLLESTKCYYESQAL